MRASGGRRESRPNRARTQNLFGEDNISQSRTSFAKATTRNFIRRRIRASADLCCKSIARHHIARREEGSHKFNMGRFTAALGETSRICTRADFASSAKRGESGGAQLGSGKPTTKSPAG